MKDLRRDGIDLRRGGDRFRTVAAGLDSRHSFSYAAHYDPDNLGFGMLMAHNEDRLAPGAGFDRHAHRGIDIVTWVLAGTVAHQHWAGSAAVAQPGTGPNPVGKARLNAGMAQVLRTGTGVDHAERAADDGSAGTTGAHYVQMWVASGAPLAAAEYEARNFTSELAVAGPPRAVPVASGRIGSPAGSALTLSQPAAELSIARLPVGARLELTAAALVHVFLARGVVTTDRGTRLRAGDALRLTGAPPPTVQAVEASEILIWALRH